MRMKILHIIFAAFRKMPQGLRFASLVSLLLAFCLPAAVLPIGEFFVQGDRVSFAEFWHRGGGIIFLLVGLVSAMLFYGFVMARRWARHLAVAFGWFAVAATFIGWQGFTLDVVFAFLIFGGLPTWYLYCRQPVRDYFGVRHESRVA